VNYSYDPVGNRTQKVSTLPEYPGGLSNYNANDQLSSDTYDANGNTTASNGNGYVYDFENRLVQQGGISIVYDGDGNRVSKTVAGVSIRYLVDAQNPTGYAQMVSETQSSGASTVYVYGLERISLQFSAGPPFYTGYNRYYVYDGHGSVRALTDTTGTVTDTYDYDAFGVLIHQTGTTPNTTLYSGEQFDSDLNLYYNRARYLNTSTGRFWTMDTDEGNDQSPPSLHKYNYGEADPVDNIDPEGTQIDAIGALSVSETLSSLSSLNSFQILSDIFTLKAPTYKVLTNKVVAALSQGFYKDFALEIDSDERSTDRYLVVQWVKGSIARNSEYLRGINQGEFKPFNFKSWIIDSASDTNAEYPGFVDPALTRDSKNGKTTLYDKPGTRAVLTQGSKWQANLSFRINIYDRLRTPNAISAFSDINNPKPLSSYDWFFNTTYVAPTVH
jgi:RHS repeat-associated protein